MSTRSRAAGRRQRATVEAEHIPYAHRPNGPAFAGVIAAAFGSFVLGLMTTLAEASATLKDWLIFREPVGPLSGKTTVGVAAWAVSWIVLSLLWRRRDVSTRAVVVTAAILIGFGVLFTYPTFFEQFAPAE